MLAPEAAAGAAIPPSEKPPPEVPAGAVTPPSEKPPPKLLDGFPNGLLPAAPEEV